MASNELHGAIFSAQKDVTEHKFHDVLVCLKPTTSEASVIGQLSDAPIIYTVAQLESLSHLDTRRTAPANYQFQRIQAQQGTKAQFVIEHTPSVNARLSLNFVHTFLPEENSRDADSENVSQFRSLQLGRHNMDRIPRFRKIEPSSDRQTADEPPPCDDLEEVKAEDKSGFTIGRAKPLKKLVAQVTTEVGAEYEEKDGRQIRKYNVSIPTSFARQKREKKQREADMPPRIFSTEEESRLPSVRTDELLASTAYGLSKEELDDRAVTDSLWEVILSYSAESINSINWWSPQQDFGSETDIVIKTRDFAKQRMDIHILVVDSTLDMFFEPWCRAFLMHCSRDAMWDWIKPRDRFFVQQGMISDSLPSIRNFNWVARLAFPSWNEYTLCHGIQLIEGLKVYEELELLIKNVDMRVIVAPGTKDSTNPLRDRAYLAVLTETEDQLSYEELLEKTRFSDLRVGDRVGISFNTSKPSKDDWSATVLSTSDGLPGEVFILLIRPYDKETGEYDNLPISSSALDSSTCKNNKQLRTALDKLSPFVVGVRLDEESSLEYKRNLNGLKYMTENKNDLWTTRRSLLLMNDFGHKAPVIDFYLTLSEEAMTSKFDRIVKPANEEQKRAFNALRCTPYGVFLLTGCAGSGKTWFLQTLMRLFLGERVCEAEGEVALSNQDTRDVFVKPPTTTTKEEAKSKVPEEDPADDPIDSYPVDKHQTLLIVPLNSTLNATAEKLHQTVKSSSEDDPPIIVRVYSSSIDRKIFNYPADVARQAKLASNPTQPTRARPEIFDDSANSSKFQSLDLIVDLMGKYKDLRNTTWGTADSRLGDHRLSLGYWVGVVTGLIGERHPKHTNPNLFTNLIQQYNHYRSDKPYDKALLSNEYNRACRYVMRVADVIATTPANCGDTRVFSGSHPNLVILDEAGKISERFLISMFAYFPFCRRFLIIGDPKQNRAHQGYVTSSNTHFFNQGTVTLLDRLLATGARTVELRIQSRQTSDINALANKAWYGGRLVTNPKVDAHPMVALVRGYMRTSFQIDSNLVFVDVNGTKAVRVGRSPSISNHGQLQVAIQLIVDLLRAKFDVSKVMFMAPYLGQLNAMMTALKLLHKEQEFKHLGLDQLACSSYDSMQGQEADIIVTTLTVCDRLGFMKDRRRMNTALTRPRFGLIIVGSIYDMCSDARYRGSAVEDLVKFVERQKIVCEWKAKSATLIDVGAIKHFLADAAPVRPDKFAVSGEQPKGGTAVASEGIPAAESAAAWDSLAPATDPAAIWDSLAPATELADSPAPAAEPATSWDSPAPAAEPATSWDSPADSPAPPAEPATSWDSPAPPTKPAPPAPPAKPAALRAPPVPPAEPAASWETSVQENPVSDNGSGEEPDSSTDDRFEAEPDLGNEEDNSDGVAPTDGHGDDAASVNSAADAADYADYSAADHHHSPDEMHDQFW